MDRVNEEQIKKQLAYEQYQNRTQDNPAKDYGQCVTNAIQSYNQLQVLKQQRESLFKELSKVNDKIETLEHQPQWVLDIVNKMYQW